MPASFEIRTLAVDPRQPKRVYAAGPTGLFRSENAGRTWDTINQAPAGAAVTALALDPAQSDKLYAVTATGKIFVSDDATASWRAVPP